MGGRPQGRAGKRPAAKKSRPRPRKRPRAGRPWWEGGLFWAACLSLGVLGLVLVWLWGSPGHDAPAPGPTQVEGLVGPAPPLELYEEPLPAPVHHAGLQTLDEALLAGLRQAGVEPGQLQMRFTLEPQGEVTLISARLKPGQDGQALLQALEQAVRPLGVNASRQTGDKGLVLELASNGHPTHRVLLLGLAAIPPAPRSGPAAATPPPLPPRPAGLLPQVAIVIDDLGQQMEAARRLLALDLALTFSVLPHSPHGREVAQMARAKGRQVLVHLPMEARSSAGLGPGALMLSMSHEQLAALTLEDWRSVPGAAGANNHMGSRMTEDPAALAPIMQALRSQGLFFLDSVTTGRSQAFATAKKHGLRASQRDIFLDHDPSPPAVERQMERMLRLAKLQGRAIAIGHPHASTLEVLGRFAPRLRAEVEVVPVEMLLEATENPGVALDSQARNP